MKRALPQALWFAGAAVLLGIGVLLLPRLFERSSRSVQRKITEAPAVEPVLAPPLERPLNEDWSPPVPRQMQRSEHALRGSVSFADGASVERGSVYALLGSGHLVETRISRGRYEFEKLSGSRVSLWCRVRGYPQVIQEVPLTSERGRWDFELPPLRRVVVRAVTSDGRSVRSHPGFLALKPSPISVLHAIATRARPASRLPPCRQGIHSSYGVGRFVGVFGASAVSVPGGALGVLIVDHDEPFHVSLVCGHQVIDTEHAASSSEVVFELAPEVLEKLQSALVLRLQDEANGATPAAARARLDLGTIMGIWHDADEDGVVTVVAPTSGLHTLLLEAPGYASVEKVVPLDAGSLRQETVRLRPARTIEGRVTRLDGKSVSGSIYCQEPSAIGLSVLSERRRFPLSADGSFRIRNVPPGLLNLVLVMHDGVRAARTVDTAGGSVGEVAFEVSATHPVLLRSAEGSAAGGTYTVLDSEERAVWSGSVSSGDIIDLRLAAGEYTALRRRHAPEAPVESLERFRVSKGGDHWVTLPDANR